MLSSRVGIDALLLGSVGLATWTLAVHWILHPLCNNEAISQMQEYISNKGSVHGKGRGGGGGGSIQLSMLSILLLWEFC